MSTMQDLGPFEKLLTVEVGETDLEAAKGRAARRISRDLKIKGFRPGKAPRKIVEATVGESRVRAEAIEELLPEIVTNALADAELSPAVAPSVEEMRDVDAGVEVDVRVTMWPTPDNVPTYADREFEIENPDLPEEAIQEQLDRLRDQFAELETVGRPSVEGDYVTVNLNASKNGQPLDEASATDLLYEVGSQSFIEGLDGKTLGRSAGDIESFETVLPAGFGELGGTEVSMQVLVKEVKEKKLPDLTDEWVSDFTEFETVDEIRNELSTRLDAMRLNSVREAFQSKVIGDLLDELDVEIPEAIVNGEMEETFHRFSHQLGDSGIEFAQYLELSGQTQEAFLEDLKAQAIRSVETDLLLDAVVDQEGISLDAGEMDAMYEALAAQSEETAEQLRERLADSVQEKRIVGDILRRKALAAILQSAVSVDESGNPFDLAFDAMLGEEADVVDAQNDTAGDTAGDTADDTADGDAAEADKVDEPNTDEADRDESGTESHPDDSDAGDLEPEGGADAS